MITNIVLVSVGSGILVAFLVKNDILPTFKNVLMVVIALVLIEFGSAGLGEQKGIDDHTCPSQPPHTRQTLKLHLASHGKVSDGHRLTAADSKLWDLCTAVCVPDQDYIETMRKEEIRVLGE